MWQIRMKPALILFIFGTYHESGFQIPCAKYKHSVINGQHVRSHHNIGKSLTLKATIKRTHNKSLFIAYRDVYNIFLLRISRQPFFIRKRSFISLNV